MTSNADSVGRYRATVGYNPPVVIPESWYADNGRETGVFPTQAEAIAFCEKVWRVPAEQVRVLPHIPSSGAP